MKIYISSDIKKHLPDYINLSPCDSNDIFRMITFEDLQSIICDAEAMDIIVDHALCYVEASKIIDTLQLVISKLHHGGKLTICDMDLEEVIRLYSEYKMTLGEFNGCIHGFKYIKKSSFSQKTIVDILKQYGLKILKRRYNETEFVVEAIRP